MVACEGHDWWYASDVMARQSTMYHVLRRESLHSIDHYLVNISAA